MRDLCVRDTYLSAVKPGDLILYKAQGLMNGDFLGELIARLEGGDLRLTHAAIVRDVPHPEAEVYQAGERNGEPIFKVREREWFDNFELETQWEGEKVPGVIKRNTMGMKLEATYPVCREWPIAEWDSEHIEIFRVRNLTADNVADVLHAAQDMVGTGPFDDKGNHADAWQYNIAEFLTFGFLNQAAARICSEFCAVPIYNSTLLRGCANGKYAIALTPDLRGIRDPEITPNDLILSGMAFPIKFQGLLK